MIPGPDSFALYACTGFVWNAINYLPKDPCYTRSPEKGRRPFSRLGRWELWVALRSCLAGLAVAAFAGWHHALGLGLLTFAVCLALPLSRRHLVSERNVAELEIPTNVAFALITIEIISHLGLGLRVDLLPIVTRFPLLPNYLLSAALLIFAMRGGTYIVRGVLTRGGTMPPDPGDVSPGDLPGPSARLQLNHGRLIGDVERLILALLVASGQYASLAFFFAAKGLIRSKDLELRAWADYLLLGSLTSFLVALVVGMLIGKVMSWR